MRPLFAPFGTSRPSALYGTSRSMGLRALWYLADPGEDAKYLREQPVHAHAYDDERDAEADPVEHPHRHRPLAGAEQLRERRAAVEAPADSDHGEQGAEGLHAGAKREVPRHEDRHVDAG